MVPVISFIGRSNSGKTTYLEKLIPEMKRRGYKIAIIKHDAHGFEMDHPGKDTWRHAQAGADVVCIAASEKMAMIRRLETEMPLREIVQKVEGVDFIFTEGFKSEGWIKIEVLRRATGQEPVCPPDELVALVTDIEKCGPAPCFGLNDVGGMADFLIEKYLTRL